MRELYKTCWHFELGIVPTVTVLWPMVTRGKGNIKCGKQCPVRKAFLICLWFSHCIQVQFAINWFGEFTSVDSNNAARWLDAITTQIIYLFIYLLFICDFLYSPLPSLAQRALMWYINQDHIENSHINKWARFHDTCITVLG